MPKVFLYQGKSLEELQAMSLEQLLPLLPARTRRTLKRGLTEVQRKLLEKIRKYKGTDRLIRTKARDMPVLPEMVGAKLGVHNGKEFKPVLIIPEMIGHRLGEFVLTRERVRHGAPGFGATRGSKYVPLK